MDEWRTLRISEAVNEELSELLGSELAGSWGSWLC
jgi:hypothetical protein